MDTSLKSVNIHLCPLKPLKGLDKGGMHSVPFHKLMSFRRDKTNATTDDIILQATNEVNSSGTTMELKCLLFLPKQYCWSSVSSICKVMTPVINKVNKDEKRNKHIFSQIHALG